VRGTDPEATLASMRPLRRADATGGVAAKMADAMLAKGIYVRAFSYPVVPKGKARIRTQMSAGLTREQLDKAIKAFEEARAEIG
jgi:7-keto-8-aminopelargonate synthetase-like enzyme